MRTLLMAVALLVAAGSGCRKADRCVPMCQQRSKELKCPRPERCKQNCDELHNPPTCGAEMKVFETCFLAEPVSSWVCDEEGLPAVKSSSCAQERDAVMACLAKPPKPTIP